MQAYKVEVKGIIRLTRTQQASILSNIATILRSHNGGGGGRIVEISLGLKEIDD